MSARPIAGPAPRDTDADLWQIKQKAAATLRRAARAERFDRIARWVAFTVFLLLAFAASLNAQMVPPMQAVAASMPDGAKMSYKFLSGLAGVTFCYQGQAYSFINSRQDGTELADTRAHEAKHREQVARFRDCKTFDDYYHTPVGMLELEAEAYKAGACESIKRGIDPATVEQWSVQTLYRWMGGGTPLFTILEAYRKYPC